VKGDNDGSTSTQKRTILQPTADLTPTTMWRYTILSMLLLMLISSCNAFTVRRSVGSIKPLAEQTAISSRQARPISLQIHFLARKADDGDGSSAPKYTKVEDGSPLGVAIVVLGSIICLNSDQFEENSPLIVPLIFGTASLAAGISRLVRYQNKKE
jgi:hypothetical protein